MTHVHAHTHLSRRRWLQATGLQALAAGGAATLLATPRAAHAAGEYKALVCIFLYGGNDGLNMIVPTDNARYGQYSAVRKNLALPQGSLVALSGTSFGLHPSLAALGPAWNDGALAPVFNVGPLAAPLTKALYRGAAANSPLIPSNLFSHSDQQTLWETGTADSLTRTGWAGRASNVLGTTNPVISVGGNGHFGVSPTSAPLVLPGPGSSFGAVELGTESWRLSSAPYVARARALRALYAQPQSTATAEAYAALQRDSFGMSDRLRDIVKTQPGDAGASAAINGAFAGVTAKGAITTPLAQQLYQIAKLIDGRATVQGTRQIFFAQMGGFDTHSSQVGGDPTTGSHAALLKQLGDAMAAFHGAMKALGLGDAVTTFTHSDFGRTFKPNDSSGTDHAWGNQHLVLGGGVRGHQTYGTYPELTLGGPDDIGLNSWELQGRWIPTTSVDQYAATLLQWFGANSGQLDSVLPNLHNFPTRTLGFV